MVFPFKLIDLTQPLKENIPYWDVSCGFEHKNVLDYHECTTDVKFRVQDINIPAGIGTHMDSPAHCDPSGKTIDKINLQDCLVHCVVIDISEKINETYQCTSDDILSFEKRHQPIKPNDFVIIWTGWSKYWNFPEQYRNNLIFPSVSKEAAQLLLIRNIKGLGIDTLGPDTADSGYPVHQMLLSNGKYLIENIANADLLPPNGSFILIAPLLIVGGTEAPVRLIGLKSLAHDDKKITR